MDVISRRQVQLRGLSERDLQRLLLQGQWTRLRRGWYLMRPVVDEQDHHRQLVDTFLVEHAGTAVAGYVSAAVQHDLALYRADLSTVHLCRLGPGRSKRVPGMHLHTALRAPHPRTASNTSPPPSRNWHRWTSRPVWWPPTTRCTAGC